MDARWATPPLGLPTAACIICNLLGLLPAPAVLPLACTASNWAYVWWIYKENITRILQGERPIFITHEGLTVGPPRWVLEAVRRGIRRDLLRAQARVVRAARAVARHNESSDEDDCDR